MNSFSPPMVMVQVYVCMFIRLEVKKLMKEAKESQIVDECNQQDIEEYIQELQTKVTRAGAGRTHSFSH